jgi:hypothetical protein
MTLTTAFSIVGFVLTVVQANNGAGRHRGDVPPDTYQYGLFVNFINQPIYLFAICFVKLAVGAALMRIANEKVYKRLIMGVMGFMLFYTIACFFVSVAVLQPLRPTRADRFPDDRVAMHKPPGPMEPHHQGDMLVSKHHPGTIIHELSSQHLHRSALLNRHPTPNALAPTRQLPHMGHLNVHSGPWRIRMCCRLSQGLLPTKLRKARRFPLGFSQHYHLGRYRTERRNHRSKSTVPQAALQNSFGQHICSWYPWIKLQSTSWAQELACAHRRGAEK